MTRLVAGIDNRPKKLRYEADENRRARKVHQDGKPDLVPLVEWNTTGQCNLACKHCYYGAVREPLPGELTHEQAKEFISHLAEMGVPVIVFSGGEPLLRNDLLMLGEFAASKGIRPVISSNGTLFTRKKAREVKEAGFKYVGISLDGIGETNNFFRGGNGAFEQALQGVRNLISEGVSVGLRYTMTKHTIKDLPKMFDLALEEGVDRINIFHLIYSGRGRDISNEDIPFEETRKAVDFIYEKTKELSVKKPDFQVLTAGNYCDAPYIYSKIEKENPDWAPEAYRLLFAKDAGRIVKMGDGGPKLVSVDHMGNVHPSMFLSQYTFGNIKEKTLTEILTTSELFGQLSYPEEHIKGKCRQCKWLSVCGGNSRARADAFFGDLWAPDPRCYLTDEEIGLESSHEMVV
ncbi:radical SAM protein [Microaerobacter geothermalis]|uniref:radical SAM/SPASM domain-containing protein n=1 Tax=Microaerobacter geothermalis TaxID=674972 RepID=UPI001F1F1D27|nr:radical SAM protein [Microaerobacter geothermalis]MCF6092676.1 radical SAM protein [Microaerobacter geothermalis]